MATEQELFDLLRAAVSGDRAQAIAVGKKITARMTNPQTQRKFLPLLQAQEGQLMKLPSAKNFSWETPTRPLDSVRLTREERAGVEAILRDNRCAARLVEHGLAPRNRVLLDGPSGTGKTTLARAIATELQRPFGIVRMGAMIGEHMGETGRALEQMAKDICTEPCVVAFDEFDAIAPPRVGGGKGGASGQERATIVGILLAIFERLPPGCIVVATTNRLDACDDAFLRRFDQHFTLALPDEDAIQEFAIDLLARWPALRIPLVGLELGSSYATAERAVFNAVRDVVLATVESEKLTEAI